jgi:membrane-associated phospholipid phosphatase
MGPSIFEPSDSRAAEIAASTNEKIFRTFSIFRLRIEEFLAVLAFGPMIYYTSIAYFYFKRQGYIPPMFIGDIQRVVGILIAVAIALLIIKYRPRWRFLRSVLPFAYCLAIYTNLHDTIHFVNPHDIHFALIKIDRWLFGAQPSVWAQQFVHPWLTEIFSFFYWIYFLLVPLVAFVLYLQNRIPEFREALVSTLLCFYAGYILYVIFPAVSPDVILKDMFTVKLNGTPLTDATMRIAGTLPSDVRDAFPSLHAGIALLSLLFAWKYVRWLFWIILPICIGLIVSTIYLRHHYFIDLPAGFLLGYLGFRYGRRIDSWWRSRNPDI